MANTYSESEVLLIVAHLNPLIRNAEKTAASFAKIKPEARTAYVRGMVTYWTNVASGLRWALSAATHKQERPDTDAKPTKRSPPAGTAKRG